MAMEGLLLRSGVKKPATLRYPFERLPTVDGFRGKPVWDMTKCIGCGLCERDCPTAAIEMTGRVKAAEFKVHYDRCSFCGQCFESCPVGAIEMTKQYELAAFDHDMMKQEYKRPKPAEAPTTA